MRTRFLLLSIFVLCFCSCTKIIWTAKPLITNPSDFDFGFVGKWVREPVDDFPGDDPMATIVISRDEESGTVYTAVNSENPEDFRYSFTTLRMSDDSKYALIQFDISQDVANPAYVYGFGNIQNDKLFFWSVHSDKLIKLVKEKVLDSVIDRGSLMTEITADPDKLRQFLIDNADKLVDEKPGVFNRVK